MKNQGTVLENKILPPSPQLEDECVPWRENEHWVETPTCILQCQEASPFCLLVINHIPISLWLSPARKCKCWGGVAFFCRCRYGFFYWPICLKYNGRENMVNTDSIWTLASILWLELFTQNLTKVTWFTHCPFSACFLYIYLRWRTL